MDVIERLDIIGAPSSAAAFAPGQEQGPAAIRAAGLMVQLAKHGVTILDRGDVPGVRWRADHLNPRAMNAEAATAVARAVAVRVAEGLADGAAIMVLGGDCTVGLGTVAGALVENDDLGLVYFDLDTDLNTPASVIDGALDWMGVAHLLGLEGTVPGLAGLGPRNPMLRADQIHYLGTDNSTAFERQVIEERGIAEIRLAEVAADPVGAARRVVNDWAPRFGRILVHLDVDVLDFADLPIAEEARRNRGLGLRNLESVVRGLVNAPNWVGLTICEVNPDHGEPDGSTLRTFTELLASCVAGAPRLHRPTA
jgi:arginase